LTAPNPESNAATLIPITPIIFKPCSIEKNTRFTEMTGKSWSIFHRAHRSPNHKKNAIMALNGTPKTNHCVIYRIAWSYIQAYDNYIVLSLSYTADNKV
jgi:hypothetical protein